MQTLGLADSTPRSEGRIKSLLWPSIRSGADVDYLGAQGYWLCCIFAVFALFATFAGHPISGVLSGLLYYLSGVGIRERSRYAAAVAFVFSLGELLVGPSVLKVLFVALLFSNLRATWMAANWRQGSEESLLPPRLGETWGDKFADRLPLWLWPKVRILYYIFSAGFTVCFLLGLAILLYRGAWPPPR